MRDIRPGDVVVATRDGGHDRDGFPRERPLAGRTYRVTGIYEMRYGLGCTLAGMDPFPYKGYFLYVKGKGARGGWYFERLAPADSDFTEMLRKIKVKHDA